MLRTDLRERVTQLVGVDLSPDQHCSQAHHGVRRPPATDEDVIVCSRAVLEHFNGSVGQVDHPRLTGDACGLVIQDHANAVLEVHFVPREPARFARSRTGLGHESSNAVRVRSQRRKQRFDVRDRHVLRLSSFAFDPRHLRSAVDQLVTLAPLQERSGGTNEPTKRLPPILALLLATVRVALALQELAEEFEVIRLNAREAQTSAPCGVELDSGVLRIGLSSEPLLDCLIASSDRTTRCALRHDGVKFSLRFTEIGAKIVRPTRDRGAPLARCMASKFVRPAHRTPNLNGSRRFFRVAFEKMASKTFSQTVATKELTNGRYRTRTSDIFLVREALYQLS